MIEILAHAVNRAVLQGGWGGCRNEVSLQESHLQLSQLHLNLETEKCVGANWRQLQQAADGHQLTPRHVVQGYLVLSKHKNARLK